MATITFLAGENNDIYHMLGSGLGFYGSTFGSSVQIGSYQDSTFVTDSTGSVQGVAAENVKYVNAQSGVLRDTLITSGVVNVPNQDASLNVRFDHTSAVNVQNCQLRIYDRENINFPASGVLTKVAEISNPSIVHPSTIAGSGDSIWWGDDERPAYTNAQGVTFVGGSNGDTRLGGTALETVGGTGMIVPLMRNPGSGNRLIGGDPAFTNKMAGSTACYGGTGIDMRHDWYIAISASPREIGSKTQYGLYFSLEYL